MRHEKELLTLPVSPCPDISQKPTEKIDQYKKREYFRFYAEIVPFEDGDVLTVTTYDTTGKAEYRFFQNDKHYGMQVFEKEAFVYGKDRIPGKFYECSVDSQYREIIPSWWRDSAEVMYSTESSCETVYRFLGKSEKDGEPLVLLVKKQMDLRKAKIEARDSKKRDYLRAAFTGVDKEIPKEFEAWAEEMPLRLSRYFFYDYTGKKLQSGTCSHCLKRAELPNVRERETGICPNCGTEFTFYSAKRLSRSKGIAYRSLGAFLVPVNENRVALRYCNVGISLRGGILGKIEKRIWAYETKRIFFDGNGELCDMYCNPEGTTKVYVDNLVRCITDVFLDCYIAPMHMETVRKRMGIRAPLEILAEYGLQANPHRLFSNVKKNPAVEYLIKMGLYGLANNELVDDGKQPVLLKGKKAYEILGVDPNIIPMLKEVDPTAKAFLTIRTLCNGGLKLTVRDMRDIDDLNINWRNCTQLSAMEASSSIHKALKYIRAQTRIYGKDGSHVCQEWGDYVAMAQKLGINLGDHCALFPKNLLSAHLEASKIQENRKNAKLNKKMAATAEKLMDLCWEFNGLIIRPAVDQAELFEEGKLLSHCVGRMGYAEKQADGRTAIFFIRKAKMPETSYVTLELDLKKWESVQCYGSHDSYPGKQVNAFVKRWINEIVKPSRTDSTARVRIAG